MKVGDKVKIIDGKNHGFEVGEIGIITNIHKSSNEYLIRNIKNKDYKQWVDKNQIELISETLSYYSFFRFLHPNMEETVCKELFDKIIKEYESSDRVE